jgi:PAS domain S-box-containing protein
VPIEQLKGNPSFLHEIIEAVPGAVYAKDRAGRILLGNTGFAQAVGWECGGFIGKNDLELLADKDLARTVMENDQRIMAAGARCQVEEVLRGADGTTSYWLSTKAPFTDENGDVVGLVGVSIDVTERKRLERREKLLAQEIEHRNKNLMGVVQSVVRLTRAATTEEFREKVVSRLVALGRAQGVLKDEARTDLDLRDLLLAEVAAYNREGEERVRLSGPPVRLGAGAVQPLTMVFHELATNAAKYGAFADPSGTLEAVWDLSRSSEARLEIQWRETRASPLEAPSEPGFGSKLIRALVEQQLRGSLSTRWETSGLQCVLSIPQDAVTAGLPLRD